MEFKKSRVTGTCGIITKDLTFMSSDFQKEKKNKTKKSTRRNNK